MQNQNQSSTPPVVEAGPTQPVTDIPVSGDPPTKPLRPRPTPPRPLAQPPGRARQTGAAILQACFWGFFILLLLGLSVSAGGVAGFRSGEKSRLDQSTEQAAGSLDNQFELAQQDQAEGRLEIARQRYEYILAHDPAYPGATDKLAEVMGILYATATPTPPLPTVTPTPTRDLRPVSDLFQQAQTFLAAGNWSGALDTLDSLRKADPNYQTARVDGMMFIALRMRGFDKIWKEGNLEGGSFDLALASRFGPLDSQSNSARELARLYMIGSSFWEVYPEQAVNYFSQVAAAAPGLRDISGWTASARYRAVLIQFGDQLAGNKDWCNAQKQYELALSMGSDDSLPQKLEDVKLKCTPPTGTITNTPASTPGTPTSTWTVAPSATPGGPSITPTTAPTHTPTQQVQPSPTNTTQAPPTSAPPSNTPAPPPTDTPAPPPTDTPALPPTDTPAPPPTDTPAQPAAPTAAPTSG